MIRILTLSLFLATAAHAAPPQLIFNGKNLDGWVGDPDLWRVEDGAIVGETTDKKKANGNTFLIWKGGELGDFTLTFRARVTGKNNSGVQYRSKIIDAEKWVVGGYQADMHPSPNYLGMLYEEKGRGIVAQRGQQVVVDAKGKKHVVGSLDKSAKINLADWNTYMVVAKGNRIEHFVNGKLTMRLIDNEEAKRALFRCPRAPAPRRLPDAGGVQGHLAAQQAGDLGDFQGGDRGLQETAPPRETQRAGEAAVDLELEPSQGQQDLRAPPVDPEQRDEGRQAHHHLRQRLYRIRQR